MYTDDDVLVTRWQRWRRRLEGVSLDGALKVSLLIMSFTMALGVVVALAQTVVSAVTALAAWVY